MTVDVAVFQGVKPRTTLRYASSATQAGTPKLVVRFVSIFLSDYDAVRDRGTSFCQEMRAGILRTNANVIQYFALAAAEVIRQLGDQTKSPATERIDRAVLTGFTRTDTSLALTVTLQTPGGAIDIQLPVKA